MDLTKRIKDSNSRRKRGFEPKNFFSWLADHGDPSSDDIAEVSSKNIMIDIGWSVDIPNGLKLGDQR